MTEITISGPAKIQLLALQQYQLHNLMEDKQELLQFKLMDPLLLLLTK